MKTLQKTVVLLCLCAIHAVADETVTLTITVTGLSPNEGQIIVSLFDEEKQYLKQPLSTLRESIHDGDTLDVEFANLKAGLYAVSMFYDLDNDGELDTGMFRIPKEPIGFSNNARGKFGPAKWQQTNFQIVRDLHVTIHVADVIK